MVEEVLDEVDGLANGPLATGVLVKDAEGRVADGDGGLNTGGVFAVAELLVLVHATQLALCRAEETLVTGAETGTSAVNAEARGGETCGGSKSGEKRGSRNHGENL